MATRKSPTMMTDAELSDAIRHYMAEIDDSTPRYRYPKKGQRRALSNFEWEAVYAYGERLFAERKIRAARAEAQA